MTGPLDRTQNAQDSGAGAHRWSRRAWIAAAAMVGVVLLGVGLEAVTASPALCAACHEIQPKVDSWRVSPHTQVGCQPCHEAPWEWYELPQTLATRGAVLWRDVGAHMKLGDDEALPSSVTTDTVPDSNCLACHDPSREVTARFGTLIDHDEHSERNGSCISCHMWTAHPDSEADSSLLFMERCFTCHGTPSFPDASTDCDVCHIETFELVPVTHEPGSWQSDHGEYAIADRPQCLLCHEEATCAECHGLEMPHPEGWAGAAPAHGAVSREIRQTCEKCHGPSPDFCTVCHHEGYLATRGTWVAQHSLAAVQEGAAICIECHNPTFCSACHTSVSS